MNDIGDLMRLAPVIPVLVIDEEAHAVPVAEALVEGGLPVLEVTLRTPAALSVIRRMGAVPGAIVGAGTVLDPAGFDAAVAAGARFIVSPGLTNRLAVHATAVGLPFLPGVATASDLMRGRDHGFRHFKFFPATAAGGLPALAALAAPFGDVRFCPTGGITVAAAPDWLAHPSVLCVGGSWIVPRGAPDTAAICAAARAAAALRAQAKA
jgi:2-dehydro-3-deoxyphosphogluconate aldolase/(4S)-4-hydroxy-2-oxoglutarate aldolase